MDKALVVFSGGQDSTTCLGWAIEKYGRENVTALCFYYGQKHSLEVKQAELIAEELQVKFELMDIDWLGRLSSSALTRDDIKVPEAGKYPKGGYPPTFVPGRNHMFLSLAAIYAFHNDITKIVTGVCETDFSGYPDCRDGFVRSLNVTLQLAMDFQFEIETPLMRLNKAETWEMADDLGILDLVYNKTLTCYNGVVGEGCGECDSCKLRKKGYEEYMKIKESKYE